MKSSKKKEQKKKKKKKKKKSFCFTLVIFGVVPPRREFDIHARPAGCYREGEMSGDSASSGDGCGVPSGAVLRDAADGALRRTEPGPPGLRRR
jgi:hypothetical protein